MNREAQECWDDDGGAVPLVLAIQHTDSRGPATASTPVVGAVDRPTLLSHLEVANRYLTESEHRIARQQNVVSKLRDKRQAATLAVEFLRSLQASRVLHRAGRDRLLRALAILDANRGTIEPIR